MALLSHTVVERWRLRRGVSIDVRRDVGAPLTSFSTARTPLTEDTTEERAAAIAVVLLVVVVVEVDEKLLAA